jgi:hypothetical protein
MLLTERLRQHRDLSIVELVALEVEAAAGSWPLWAAA